MLCLRDLPSRLLPNHRGLSSVPAAVHYLRSLVPGDAFHFVRLIKVSVQVKVKIDSRGIDAGDIHKRLAECANERPWARPRRLQLRANEWFVSFFIDDAERRRATMEFGHAALRAPYQAFTQHTRVAH